MTLASTLIEENSFSMEHLMLYFSKGNCATLWKALVVVFPWNVNFCKD